MNILTINNWDENQSWRANGIIQKTEIANPFNQNTIEFFLLKLLEAYDGFAVSNFLRTGNDLLLKILKEANFYYYFDSYGLYYYVDRALWLGLFHGTIKIRQRYEINQRPIFGLYLESGLFDLFSDPEAITSSKMNFAIIKN